MAGEQPKVSVIVLNWNGKRHLASSLSSLMKLDYPPDKLELILCDNGSEDGSVAWAKYEFPSVRLIELEYNHGFAQGNNLAAKQATGEWIGFLNNDMWVKPSWLNDLLSVLDEHPDAVCIASRIANWDGSKVDFVGGGINYMGQGYQLDYGKPASPHDKARRLLFACGGAMLIRRDLFLEVGGFDADYFAYFEDVDLGWRLNILGYDVWYTPRATAYHRHLSSGRRIEPQKLHALYERNAMATIYKCYDDDNLHAVLPNAMILLNERALRMSRLTMRSFIFGQDSFARYRQRAALERSDPIGKGVRVLKERGLIAFLEKALDYGVGLTLNVLLSLLRSVGQRRYWMTSVSVSHYAALSQFAHQLDDLNEKRAWVQSRRRRSDQEIIPLFQDPFFAGVADDQYVQFFQWLTRVQQLDRRFAAPPD